LDALLEASRDSGLEVAPVQVIAWARGSSELTAALEDMFAKQAELRVLRNHYTDEHPRVQQLVDELAVLERPEVPRLTWVLFRMLRARESEMFEQLAAAAAELRATPRRVIEEARLERQVQVFEDFSAELQRRYVEAMSAADSSSSALSVVELAVVPRWPVSRTRKINLILLAFVGCLAIGAAGAVVLDRLDPLLHDPAQVARELGVGVLGTVPRLELRNRNLRGMAVEQVVDAFSTIRPNLCAAYAKHGSILVAVSSFAPRDGKTLVVCNLALAFAHMGRQTVVVDAAGRRSTLHKRLDCEHGPGLTEYLAGEASWEEVGRPKASSSVLDVGTAGPAADDIRRRLGRRTAAFLWTRCLGSRKTSGRRALGAQGGRDGPRHAGSQARAHRADADSFGGRGTESRSRCRPQLIRRGSQSCG
jgi:hypothetical protein